MGWITNQIAWWLPGFAETEAEAKRDAELGDALADAFLESYICWREACGDVYGTYDRWRNSEPREGGLAFEVHRAALDREEHAADVYSRWAEVLGHDQSRAVRELSHPHTA
ncbi:MAG TPA: hypothetical protein VHH72_03540 [Solirubrobacterales bacterium]|jgi:hypothetical protein|nr:hypothetical protein [Solirubrobacterales bacterium]